MTNKPLKYLSEQEKAALAEFIGQMQERYPNEIVQVILFGSKTRGDFDEESDLDLLIVVKSDDWRLHRQIGHLAIEPMLKYDAVISTLTINQERYRKLKKHSTSLYQNLQAEGINLWMKQ